MGEKLLSVLAGVVIGVGGMLLVMFGGSEEPAKTEDLEVSKLRQENEAYVQKLESARTALSEAKGELAGARTRISELEQGTASVASAAVPEEPVLVPAEKPTGPPTEEEMEAELRRYGSSIGAVIQGGGEEAKKRLREFFERVTDEQVQALFEKFDSSADLGAKFGIAHALAQSGRPEVVEALAQIVQDPESGFLEHRVVAHGMAFSDDDAVVPILNDVARNDSDRGARANAAFGLARRGDDEGISLYTKATDEAFEAKDPEALNYLGGFMLLGKDGLPAVRERLGTYTSRQARLILIEVVRSNKDREAIPALRALVDDPDTDKSVRDNAEKAIKEIEGE